MEVSMLVEAGASEGDHRREAEAKLPVSGK